MRIISSLNACDGIDYFVELSNGHGHIFHFSSTPDDLEAVLLTLEEQVLEELRDMTLAEAKDKKILELDIWYTEQASNGVNLGTITLPSTVVDQNRYTSLAAMEHLALSLGQRQLSDYSGLADINGEWHYMPLVDLFDLLLQYGAVCADWSATYANLLTQIHSAETIEAVETITF